MVWGGLTRRLLLLCLWVMVLTVSSGLYEPTDSTFQINNFGGDRLADAKNTHSYLAIPEATHLRTGTTIVGICCRNGVVLGADTRSTGGPLVMDKNKRKIHPIAQSILCCAAGTSADCDQVTRKARHFLGLVRIEKEMANEWDSLNRDSVRTAVTHISNTIRAGKVGGSRRKVQSVLILGGVDLDGPSLFQIDADGVPLRVSFGALGSGCTDALAVLESARYTWLANKANSASAYGNCMHRASSPGVGYCFEDVDVEEATHVVRRAVQAGILNDLGSGSHVDLCVITQSETKVWRESLRSDWDSDRIDYREKNVRTLEKRAATQDPVVSSNGKVQSRLGKLIFSKRTVAGGLLSGNKISKPIDELYAGDDLGLDIEMID